MSQKMPSPGRGKSPSPTPGTSRRRFGLVAGLSVALLGTVLLLSRSFPDSLSRMSAWSAPLGLGGQEPSDDPSRTDRGASADETGHGATPLNADAELSEPTDRQLRRRLIGRWEQHHAGWRRLTVYEDGTATMTVEPEGVWKYLLGSKLRFDVEWRIEDGYLAYSTTGGRPPKKVELVKKMWGDRRRQKIEELTAERMVLLDEDGEPDDEWKRVE